MNYRLLGPAQLDVFDGIDFYEQKQTGLGQEFADAVVAFIRRIVSHPRLYGRVHRPPRGREVRQSVLKKFPFLVVYEVTTTEVVILSVTHARSVRRPWRRRL